MKPNQTIPPYRPPKRFTGNLHRIVFWVIIGILMACAFALIFGFAVKLLWSVTLVPLFALPEITYWQAVGLVILARLVFGGFGFRNKPGGSPFHENPGDVTGHPPFFGRMHDRFHGWSDSQVDENNTAGFHVPEADQQHYNEFWEKEGKQAFEEYIVRKKSNQTD